MILVYRIELRRESKYVLLMLGSLAVALLGGVLLGLSSFPERLLLDLATVLALMAGILLTHVLKKFNTLNVVLPIYLLVSYGAISTLVSWIF
jgi:hypothetical protein